MFTNKNRKIRLTCPNSVASSLALYLFKPIISEDLMREDSSTF